MILDQPHPARRVSGSVLCCRCTPWTWMNRPRWPANCPACAACCTPMAARSATPPGRRGGRPGLVRRVLHVVQGHPKLMELADAAAPTGPARRPTDAAEAAAAAVLEAFFRDGTSGLDATQFLDTLTAWTTTTLAALPEPARLMAQFLARSKTTTGILGRDANWADLRRRLGLTGEPPSRRRCWQRWRPPR